MTIHLSCGHEADINCSGADVTWEDEECVAGEGFLPVTMFGVFCHKCAMDLAAAEERAKIVAWLRSDKIVLSMDGSKEDIAASAIEAGEHLR